MKYKVALTATCLAFALCVSYLIVCANEVRGLSNKNALEQLTNYCRLSASQLDSAAFVYEDDAQAMRELIGSTNLQVAYYSNECEPLFTSNSMFSRMLDISDFADFNVGESISFERADALGIIHLMAITRLERGEYLIFSRPALTTLDVLGGSTKLLVMLAIAFLGAIALLIAFGIGIDRTNRVINRVYNVLNDFADGNFDSRVELYNLPGDSKEQAGRFNDAIARVQERVFKQKTHNQALSSVINHLSNGILAVDDRLNIILVTPTAKALLGISIAAVEGMPIHLASKDVHLEQVLRDGMNQEGIYANEVAARTATGRGHRPLRLYVSPMMKDGKVVGAVAMIEDITVLRRLEQVRTDFVANVSHELKTPLTSIKGFIETLQNGAIENPEMANKFLRIIMLEADRLTRLINDILSISKLESGRDDVPLERIRLDMAAFETADMLSIHASEKQVTIKANPSKEPLYIMGNPDRVEQMLINLIENAIKYNAPGGSVTVSVFGSKDKVNLSVSDTGIGIPEESMSRLFERFYRVDKGRSRSMGGTGLGLAIVKHIVISMDGMIEVQSKVNEGTEFLITLPRASEEDELTVDS